jgi:hypothetical protein
VRNTVAQRVIYPNDFGGLAILTPILECGLTVGEIALKDVPAGKPFLIVDSSDLPQSDEYFAAWTADFSEPDGIGLGPVAYQELYGQT